MEAMCNFVSNFKIVCCSNFTDCYLALHLPDWQLLQSNLFHKQNPYKKEDDKNDVLFQNLKAVKTQ